MNVKKENNYNLTFIAIGFYLALQIFSDIGSLKIIKLFGFSIDGGTFLYPFTFTIRDLIHRLSNKKTSQIVIIQSGFLNLFMALFFYIIGILPSDLEIGPQNEFTSVLSPIWRLVIASICAEIISEFIDTEIYSIWTKKFKNKMIWGRVISSNTIALIIDSIIFCLIAFYGTIPNSILISILISNIIVKELVTITSVPLIYLTNNITKNPTSLLSSGGTGA